jgi:hypothetical protein
LFTQLAAFGANNAENISNKIRVHWSEHMGQPKIIWTAPGGMTEGLKKLLNKMHIETKEVEITQPSALRTRISIIRSYLTQFYGIKNSTFQCTVDKISIAINTQFKTTKGQTSFQLMYGTSPRYSLTQTLGFQKNEKGICQPSDHDFCYGLPEHLHDEKRGIPENFRHLTIKRMLPGTLNDINIQNSILKFHEKMQHGTTNQQIHSIQKFYEEHPLRLGDKVLLLRLKASDADKILSSRRVGPLVITKIFGNGFYQCTNIETSVIETCHRNYMIFYKDSIDDLPQAERQRL